MAASSHATVRASTDSASAGVIGRRAATGVSSVTVTGSCVMLKPFADPGLKRSQFDGKHGVMPDGNDTPRPRPNGLRIVTLGPDGATSEEPGPGDVGAPTAEEASLAD